MVKVGAYRDTSLVGSCEGVGLKAGLSMATCMGAWVSDGALVGIAMVTAGWVSRAGCGVAGAGVAAALQAESNRTRRKNKSANMK